VIGPERPPGLPPERPGRAPPPELVARRQAVAAYGAAASRTDPPPEETRLGGVRSLRFGPPGRPCGTVLHLHGGGFRLGCPEMSAMFAAALADRCAVEVVCPDYRLAPEHPFPAGLAEAWAAITALQAEASAPLVLSGDSAGGGLAAALASMAATAGRAPAGLVLLSPWLDLTVSSRSYEINAATDPMFSRAAAKEAAELYLQGVSPRHPLASPLFAQVDGFPPTLISMGQEEVLADDGRRFHAALRMAGRESSLLAVPGMEHVAVTRSLDLPGAAATFAAVAEFVDRLTGRRT
jgi:monoterpene epsilon-lactone hydrolase